MSNAWDAVVVGAGPNGLAAALTLAREGCRVLVLEAAREPGGGLRSGEPALPGFTHDLCASVLPLAAASSFLRELPLAEHGLEWVVPESPLAQTLSPGRSISLERSLELTAAGLESDGSRYQRLLGPLVAEHESIFDTFLGPLRLPRRLAPAVRFAIAALPPASLFIDRYFRTEAAAALFAGLAAHSFLPASRPATAAFGLVLAMLGHTTGWPGARGGSDSLARALVSCLLDWGGEIAVDSPVTSIDDLPPARFALFDVTPRQLLKIAGHRLDPRYRRSLSRYRYGPGVCKVDYALSEPIPWLAAGCRSAGTVHVADGAEEIARSEKRVWAGAPPERPFVLVGQPSLYDASRAPAGAHTAWAYCHVPHGWPGDATEAIEAQVERHAPGFRDTILARSRVTAQELERHNPNCIGGDINGGVQDIRQLFTRPTLRQDPYSTSHPRLFICSSSTPPGGGVHGLCGYHGARSALRKHGHRPSAHRGFVPF